jgi:hypothetical protein
MPAPTNDLACHRLKGPLTLPEPKGSKHQHSGLIEPPPLTGAPRGRGFRTILDLPRVIESVPCRATNEVWRRP